MFGKKKNDFYVVENPKYSKEARELFHLYRRLTIDKREEFREIFDNWA